MLDNSILPPQDMNSVRVSTPPRAIKLSEHHFPTAAEDQYTPDEEQMNGHEYDQSSVGSMDDRRLTVIRPKKLLNNEFFNLRSVFCDQIPFNRNKLKQCVNISFCCCFVVLHAAAKQLHHYTKIM